MTTQVTSTRLASMAVISAILGLASGAPSFAACQFAPGYGMYCTPYPVYIPRPASPPAGYQASPAGRGAAVAQTQQQIQNELRANDAAHALELTRRFTAGSYHYGY